MGKDRINFEQYYGDLYRERWPLIREALKLEPRYYELPTSGEGGRGTSYFLDEASYRTALLLSPDEGEEVLDMCAAPGGKSLSLISAFPTIHITSNEVSRNRKERLRRVLEEHLSEQQLQRVRITGYNALTWFRHEQARYDRILLDVPCSSERHVLNSTKHMEQWSPSRTKRLAIQAFAMLASALEVVKQNGTILYSTCALSPLENDGVMEKLHKKRKGRFEIVPVHLPFGEQTRYGWQVIPDSSGGRGPMYAAMVKRRY